MCAIGYLPAGCQRILTAEYHYIDSNYAGLQYTVKNWNSRHNNGSKESLCMF